VDKIWLGDSGPIERLHTRLLVPRARVLEFASHGPGAGGPELAPSRVATGELTEYVWNLQKVPAYIAENDEPAWHDDIPWVQVSEFESWEEVARWGAQLFRQEDPLTGPLHEWVTAQRHAARSREDFILRAIRFIQDDVRYVGIETGI